MYRNEALNESWQGADKVLAVVTDRNSLINNSGRRAVPVALLYPMSFLLDFLGVFQGTEGKQAKMEHLHLLTASDAFQRIRDDSLTVEDYAKALLERILARDDAVKAWAFLDRELVLRQARALDEVSREERGPLHGVPIGVKDIIYTKGRLVNVVRRMLIVLRALGI